MADTYAQRELRRIAERIASGTLNFIANYGQLTPMQRLALARGTRK